MKKHRLEIILFVVNAIYMILELIASRILSPYFGNSNMVWTSVIGIILLSSSVGNYLGGVVADKNSSNKNVKIILGISGILIMFIPLLQRDILFLITSIINNIKIGAIIATIMLFFIPSMFIGMLSPIIVKLKMNDLEKVGKVSGKISAIATLGSITGTFVGGFYLIPRFGCNELLFVLAIIMFLLIFITDNDKVKKNFNKTTIFIVFTIMLSILCFYLYTLDNKQNAEKVLNGELNTSVSYDTEYGRVLLYNTRYGQNIIRNMNIDKGNESATYIEEDKSYELVYEYTKYYDLMFKSQNEIKDVLMIGGAGYSYPKYYISKYLDKNMDVVEIDGKVTQIAREYFYLDKLIEEYNLNESKRLNIITQDGRTYLNKNQKKYDAILNDAFAGETPAQTLTTTEAVKRIYSSLNEKGVYLTNIISSIEGENSKFIKAELKTLKQVFKNVYVVPCNDKNNFLLRQNNMVIATDEELEIEGKVEVNINDAVILTDNYCPVDSLIQNK